MKHNYLHFFVIISLVLFSHAVLIAQKGPEAKLIGCWEVNKFEFLQPVDDSLDLIKASKGYITCFESNGKFITKQKKGNVERVIGTGTYQLDADGKTIHQKRDIEDSTGDDDAEIMILDHEAFVIKVGNVIMHFKRYPG